MSTKHVGARLDTGHVDPGQVHVRRRELGWNIYGMWIRVLDKSEEPMPRYVKLFNF